MNYFFTSGGTHIVSIPAAAALWTELGLSARTIHAGWIYIHSNQLDNTNNTLLLFTKQLGM